MTPARMLTEAGLRKFAGWLADGQGRTPPTELLDGEEVTELFEGFSVDPGKQFGSRFEFGQYLKERLASASFDELTSVARDGLWAWLAVVYFDQLSEKGIRRSEHYIVTRRGSAGSLAYRQAVRVSYEMVCVHGDAAMICLRSPMHTFGDIAEQLASRQTIAHNRGFFRAAYDLYMREGKLRRGAASKPKKLRQRKPGDRTGFGSIRRLSIALQRLDLTFDTEQLDSVGLISILPREFAKWKDEAPAAPDVG